MYDASGATSTVVAQFTQTTSLPGPPPTSTWDIVMPYDPLNIPGNPAPVTLAMSGGTPDISAGGTSPLGKMTLGNYTVDVNDLTSYSGQSDARVFDTDGQAAGALTSLNYSVNNTGQIIGIYSNGLKEVLGQVAMATFKNAEGLEKTGDSQYRSTVNSGYAQVGQPGSAGMGQVISGALEMSNVDLAQEFTNLVIAQRGFQANSRVITTSDELLQELVSMKR